MVSSLNHPNILTLFKFDEIESLHFLPGFLYILNEGPHDKGRPPDFVVLFPAPTSTGGSALVTASQPIQIPEKSWIKFDKEQGTERVWLVFAPTAVPELEPIRPYAGQPTQGLITDADSATACSTFSENRAKRNLPLSKMLSERRRGSPPATPFSFTLLVWNISDLEND
jgi:hypothetical protein